jgi:hypothetical protein
MNRIREIVANIKSELGLGNSVSRITLLIVVYVLFSMVGAYNLAHLSVFVYIIYLLEKISESKN